MYDRVASNLGSYKLDYIAVRCRTYEQPLIANSLSETMRLRLAPVPFIDI